MAMAAVMPARGAIAMLVANRVTVAAMAALLAGRVAGGGNRDGAGRAGDGDSDGGDPIEHVFAAGTVALPPRIELRTGFVAGGVVGRRSVAAESRRGREVRAVPNVRPTDLAVTATLHHSLMRTGGLSPAGRLDVTAEDLHQKVKAGRQGNLMLFVVDASGSMAALQRMEMVKATVLSLLRDAYERRDEVGVIAFSWHQGGIAALSNAQRRHGGEATTGTYPPVAVHRSLMRCRSRPTC